MNRDAQERAKLVGVWKGFAVEGKGETPDRGPVKLELTFTEKTIHGIEIKQGRRVDHGTGDFFLDLDASPPHLDGKQVNERGRTRSYVGIYALEGDTLKWCVSPKKIRPTTFETMKGQFLLILKRDKKLKILQAAFRALIFDWHDKLISRAEGGLFYIFFVTTAPGDKTKNAKA